MEDEEDYSNGSNKNITPLKWRAELDSISREFDEVTKQYSDTMVKLAAMEVLDHNRKELNRVLENESHQSKSKGREFQL